MDHRLKFQQQMTDVYQHILRMGSLVEEALRKALMALSDHDLTLARQVIEADTIIDEYQYRIEDLCTIIIATEQPVASDLRELVTIIKIVSDLERIGDHARHLAKTVTVVSESLIERAIPLIQAMTERGIQMVHESLTALTDRNSEKAIEVAKMDTEIDRLHHDLHGLIISLMKQYPEKIEEGTALIFLNRFLERLGDHVSNMCSWIVFARSGVHQTIA